MENEILLFPDPKDFLNFMETLQKEYGRYKEAENKRLNNE